MNARDHSDSTRLPWLGVTCCLMSAICYTGANICLRQLAQMQADPALAIFVKETTAVLLIGPWLLWRWTRGVRIPYRRRALMILVASALLVQLAGNLGVQWALGVIGLVVSLPMVFGALLIASAVIGVVMFGERLGVRSIAAVFMVIGSVVLLNVGAAEQGNSFGLLFTLLAIGASGLAGATFAGMGAAIRYAGSQQVPIFVIVVVTTGTGTLTLGALCLIRMSPSEILGTDRVLLAWMLAAGLFNVVAFSLISKGLQLTTLVHANVLNASQVALGALAGVVLFCEPFNAWLLGGVVTTIVAIGMFGGPETERSCQFSSRVAD